MITAIDHFLNKISKYLIGYPKLPTVQPKFSRAKLGALIIKL